MEHVIKFPIGDWSDDGHGECEEFHVRSNLPVEDVREMHFACTEKLGFDIGDICHDYEDNTISPHIKEILDRHNIDYQDGVNEPEHVFHLWLDILQKINPDWNFQTFSITAPSINFYGMDEKGRHLKTPGYGVFE